MTDIWRSDSYLNQNIPYLFNNDIIEYDMEEAGFSLIREFNQLPEKEIDKIEKIKSKQERKVLIGNIQRKNADFKKMHNESFASARELFFIDNDLDPNDVISIKKDAIITSRKCKNCKVGKYINFREKNKYTSYIRLNKHLEFYYSPNKLDIKGLSDENYEKHKDGMIKFINSFFHKMETENQTNVLDYMRIFISKYKRRELDVEYYRTFDRNSWFEVNTGEKFDEYWDDEKDSLIINYNYQILLSFIKILI